ncbi:MAG: hypothetical protein V4608_07330 [Bacteroidota bacterium]
MRLIPIDIKQIIFKTLDSDISVIEFEHWVYTNKYLETIFSSDDYIDLISFNYKQELARHELIKILNNYIDFGDYETWKIKKSLNNTLVKNNEASNSIMLFYDLYCNGYYFLGTLGLKFGLALTVPPNRFGANTYRELKPEEKVGLLNSFYPDIKIEIERVLDWLDKGKIILTGAKNEVGRFEYTDNRTQAEKFLD